MICGLSFLGLTAVQAQDAGSVRANLGFAYDTDIEELGLNFGAEYFITDAITVAPNYTIFFVDPGNFSALNIDGRYYFIKEGPQVYGLFGFALRFFDAGIFNDTDGGLNFGGGVLAPLGKNFSVHGQLKYTTPFSGSFVIQGGIAYRFK